MMLRLKCLRCGDPADMNPTHSSPGLCATCRHIRTVWAICGWGWRKIDAQWLKWQKGQERHPTFIALTEALAKMEAVPHGTLEVGDA